MKLRILVCAIVVLAMGGTTRTSMAVAVPAGFSPPRARKISTCGDLPGDRTPVISSRIKCCFSDPDRRTLPKREESTGRSCTPPPRWQRRGHGAQHHNS